MPSIDSLLSYRHIRDTALEFISSTSVTDTEPQYIDGSNILTSYKGYAERRPGFPLSVEDAGPTAFTAPQRTFCWRKWAGAFYIMVCDVDTVAMTSKVYKLAVGVDQVFDRIFTSNVAEPFDFVVSNNYLFFGNGTDMKKWDGQTVTNWGISIGSSGSSSKYCGTGADVVVSTYPWVNPVRVQGAPDASYATVTVTIPTTSQGPLSGNSGANLPAYLGPGIPLWNNTSAISAQDGDFAYYYPDPLAASNILAVSNFGFALPSDATVKGIVAQIFRYQDEGTFGAGVAQVRDNNVLILQGGLTTGTDHTTGLQWPTSGAYQTYGNPTDLWGTSWTAADINGSGFGVGIAVYNEDNALRGWALVDHIKITVYYATGSISSQTDLLTCTNYGFSLPSSSHVSGISVAVTGHGNVTGMALQAKLLKAGAPSGNEQTMNLATSDSTYLLGGVFDLWGLTLSPDDVNSATFGVELYSNSTGTFSIDSAQITAYYTAAPTVTTSGTGIDAVTGYKYVYCYFNSTTGHISSPSPASLSTGVFANKQVNVTVVASTDTQVNQIRIFRTTDGGDGNFFEVKNSPVANVSGAYADTTLDVDLSTVTAPTAGFNDPPPASKGFVWYANRIWMFRENKVYATDWEEQNIGVPEESCVSGPAGNFWSYDSEITGLSVASDGILIFTAGTIRKIDGDSLDTFRRTTVSIGIGCRERATICRLGNVTAFLGNTNSIWLTDSATMNEITKFQQATFHGISHSQVSCSFHIKGEERWLLVVDRSHSQTMVYDIEKSRWMPPWSVYGYSIHSGETTPGNWDLILGHINGRVLRMNESIYTDYGTRYPAFVKLGLQPMVDEHIGSPEDTKQADDIYPQKPSGVAYMEYVGIETGAVEPSDVSYLTDDDRDDAPYTSILANKQDPPLRTQGTRLIEKWYYARQPAARRASVRIDWAASETNFRINTITIAYRAMR